ncbi:hypothetical protein IDM40_16730 [Nocardiopsis sp. HNM0947]|uniref:Glycosyltransferase n=1 Tax=Nocardiopsis coralli TaxID=2772213 RepID=A0ABR9P940_9ACTN|nr:DUF6716 putative glycosyltransferase [Nocardiopsis coralli]MBE3000334.1 hypothetical protein [Nocardiopsis coralli]
MLTHPDDHPRSTAVGPATGVRPARPARALTVLAVADTEARVRLSAAMLGAVPGEGHTVGLAVLNGPHAPAPARLRAALRSTPQADRHVPVLTRSRLRSLVRKRRPDAVLLNCSADRVAELAPLLETGTGGRRPALVSALAPLSSEVTEAELRARARTDLLVVHSHRELAACADLAARTGVHVGTALATLPYLPRTRRSFPLVPRQAVVPAPNRIVFAAQAGVPAARADRERVLTALSELARARPDLEVVVALDDAEAGEEGVPEAHPYPRLWRALVENGRAGADDLVFRSGVPASRLARPRGFVTVSSPTVLEAVAREVPVVLLSDFGVGEDLRNTAFEGSGALGTLADVRAARFRAPSPYWAVRTYFHPGTDDDWAERFDALIDRARGGQLGPVGAVEGGGRAHGARTWARNLRTALTACGRLRAALHRAPGA